LTSAGEFPTIRGSMPIWMKFIVAALATWRVTHFLVSEDGPADVVVRVRRRLGDGVLGRAMDCFWCLSIWIAAPAALFVTRHALEAVLTWLALSGAACLLERVGAAVVTASPARDEAERQPGDDSR
jgi:hypothetical protein